MRPMNNANARRKARAQQMQAQRETVPVTEAPDPWKALVWDFGPSLVDAAQKHLGATATPEEVRDLLEKNNRFVEKKIQAELAEEDVGSKIASGINKALR